MSTSNSVVVDANVLISICSKEQDTYPIADAAFNTYAQNGWEFYAPSVVVAEVLFALCVKSQSGALTQPEYDQAIEFFVDLMQIISTPSKESSLIQRAVEIRGNYVCKRMSDSLYIALAEDLGKTRVVELLSFDAGLKNQVSKNASAVSLNLLTV